MDPFREKLIDFENWMIKNGKLFPASPNMLVDTYDQYCSEKDEISKSTPEPEEEMPQYSRKPRFK